MQSVMNSWQTGIVPGLVAVMWMAWPLFHFRAAKRDLFLHPAPRIYNHNVEDAFSCVRDFLRESSYNCGDKWRAITADNATMRIVAELTYQEEELLIEMGQRGELRDRRQLVKRHIKMECQMKSEDGRAVLQFDFAPRAEGFNTASCDPFIEHVLAAIETGLGPGEAVNEVLPKPLGSPPWWLIVATCVAFAFITGLI